MDADDLFNQGREQYNQFRFREALASWEQALTLYREMGDRQGEANSLGSLGNAYHALGQVQRAITFHEQSLTLAREISDRQGEANSRGNLGLAYRVLGQYQRAINFYEQSLTLAREISDHQGETASLGNLGIAYESLGQYQRAINYLEQTLTLAREIGDRQGEANSLGSLGNAYHALGQYQRAINFHQQTLTLAREMGNRQGEAASLGNLGNAYESLGQYQRAIDYLEQTLTIEREIGYRQGEANSLNNLGVVLQKTEQFPEAEAVLRDSLTVREAIRVGLQDSHQISLFETQRSSYILLQEVLIAQDKPIEALEISERGRTRAFIDLLRQRFPEESNPYISAPQIRQVAQTQNATLVEYSIVNEELYIWVIQPTGKIEFRRSPITEADLNNLETLILRSRVSIGITEKDNDNQPLKLNPEEKPRNGHFPLLQYLYHILIAPITDLLPTNPEARVIFIPHYALYLVPFAALQNPQGRYLIEDHTLLTAPSIQVLETTHAQQQRLHPTQKKALVVAEPTLHPKFQDNPYKLRSYEYMQEAAQTIATILDTLPIIGDSATKVAVINQMLQTRIVHIFAHGLLDEYQPEDTNLGDIPGTIVLAPDANSDSDGALNAAEILDQQLNAEIVVLSACSTGKGKITGDGIIGLSRCFILAGVPSLIVSLWNIGAPAAKVLMTEFYRHLANGENLASALRQAMLHTKNTPNYIYSSPADWAGFTLIGETSGLNLETIRIDDIFSLMSIPADATAEEIIDGFYQALETNHPQLFAPHQEALVELYSRPGETDVQLAERFRQWCESRPPIAQAVTNKICTAAAGRTTSNPSAETVRKSDERLKSNTERLSTPPENPPKNPPSP
ncbi:CHAT domain-containing tetratricopeptide repeat protein [Roseofilum sp. Guam]|uniref:CHAT domain-containing protein n=1 Tax=Roseofilum sp. Guam TaxID=2821502 RepID=UPI001B0C0458|nr:CHAT domain-containing tetratricopeptide repeat protein [Roseofilum sp. Guam]MBP0026872.1 CHAT domain-containing protein [Roseofilum sp. Guam]